MSFQLPRSPIAPLLVNPAVNLLRIAAAAASQDGEVDRETIALMRRQVAEGLLADLDPAQAWAELANGLMSDAPSRMLWVLRESRALQVLLPELDALFGMPQSADDPPTVDIGEHQFRVVDEAARRQAPLAVRFAALLYNVGKSDSPPEHLPAHYRHMERGLPRIEAIAERFRVPPEFRDLAVLALLEVERVHRAAEMRAGSIAAMLERVDAFGQPQRFDWLMLLCTCDFRAYPGRATRSYPKAAMLAAALDACKVLDEAALRANYEDDPAGATDALLEARAAAVARALRSERWAGQAAD
ncbi:tRNA nucleotidyltransferase [Zoogloea sp.]|uniref:tRNA nucleotidyltransferase n=1 Tax=Zoogloea sp. TaxID=49181 RepID=UPI0035B47B11